MYEHRLLPPLTTRRFMKRMAVHGCFALSVIAASLFVGMLGYYHFGQTKSWCDAFLNAAMILSGMGPVETELSNPGKLFAGSYALYSGIVFIAVMGILLAPVVHRMLHRFHWEDENKST